MFFRKNKRDRQEDAQQQLLSDIGSAVEQAQQSPDVADKYLKLVEARARIDDTETALRKQITKDASSKGEFLFVGTVGAGTTVGALALVGLHFPPLFVIAGPLLGYYYGSRAGRDLAATAQDKALEQNKNFFEALDAKRTSINNVTAEIERTQLQTLAASPKCEEILKKAPSLRDQFAAAFGRQAAAGTTPAPEAPQTKAHDGFKL